MWDSLIVSAIDYFYASTYPYIELSIFKRFPVPPSLPPSLPTYLPTYIQIVFFKWANLGLFLFILSFQHDTNRYTYIDKSIDGGLGTRTLGSKRKAQMNPLSYGGTPKPISKSLKR